MPSALTRGRSETPKTQSVETIHARRLRALFIRGQSSANPAGGRASPCYRHRFPFLDSSETSQDTVCRRYWPIKLATAVSAGGPRRRITVNPEPSELCAKGTSPEFIEREFGRANCQR